MTLDSLGYLFPAVIYVAKEYPSSEEVEPITLPANMVAQLSGGGVKKYTWCAKLLDVHRGSLPVGW